MVWLLEIEANGEWETIGTIHEDNIHIKKRAGIIAEFWFPFKNTAELKELRGKRIQISHFNKKYILREWVPKNNNTVHCIEPNRYLTIIE